MWVKTLLLATALIVWLLLFGLSLADDRRPPVIDMQEATRIVLAQFPNARILEVELDTEHGTFVYEIELVTAEGQKKEVHVNAVTGRIEKVKND